MCKKERNYKWVDFEEIKSKAVRVYVNNNWKVELLLKDVLKKKKIMKVVLPSIDNKFINNDDADSLREWRIDPEKWGEKFT